MDLTKLAKVDAADAADVAGSQQNPGDRRSGPRSGPSGRRKQSTMGYVSVGMALVSIVLALIGIPAKHAAGFGSAVILVILMCSIAALCLVGIAVAVMGITSKRRSPLMPLIGLVLNPIVGLTFAIFLWWPTGATLMTAAENGDAEGVDRAIAMGVGVNDVASLRDQAENRFVATPLIGAAMNGQFNTVTSLISHGAEVNAVDSLGRSALYHAVKQGHGDVAITLLNRDADPNLSPDGTGPLVFAVTAGNAPLVEQMLKRGAIAQPTGDHARVPLLLAAEGGHTKIAEMLIDRGADVNATNTQGETALHIAASKGHQYVVKLLLRKQANVTLKNQFGETALERAIAGDHKPVIDDLMNVATPIDIFAAIGLGDFDRVQQELENDPTLINAVKRNLTPLHAAARRGGLEIVTLLLENDAEPNAKLDSATAITPLYLATKAGHVEVVKALIRFEAKVNDVVSVDGTTGPPLYFAAAQGYEAIVDALLAAGADVNVRCQAPPEAGSTIPRVGSPLTFAVMNGHKGVARKLLEGKANPDFRWPADGPTPLFEAVDNADLDMVMLLIEFKADVNARIRGASLISNIEQRQRGHQKAEVLDRIYSTLRDSGALD